MAAPTGRDTPDWTSQPTATLTYPQQVTSSGRYPRFARIDGVRDGLAATFRAAFPSP